MDKITKEKIDSYRQITTRALSIAKESIVKGKEKEAEEVIEMVSCYLADSKFFETNSDLINSFAALSYAHGWLDCSARLKIFNVNDSKLFTV